MFAAWTDPVELAHWFKPTGAHSTSVPELDLRVGGRYVIEMVNPKGETHRVAGEYQEISAPARLVFTWQ